MFSLFEHNSLIKMKNVTRRPGYLGKNVVALSGRQIEKNRIFWGKKKSLSPVGGKRPLALLIVGQASSADSTFSLIGRATIWTWLSCAMLATSTQSKLDSR